jgi:hypothetical protein
MYKKIFYTVLFGLSVVLFACSSRPDGVLSEKEMEAVMLDLYLVDGDASVKSISLTNEQKAPYYNAVLAKHGVTAAQVDSSLAYYFRKRETMEIIHKHVLDKLEKMLPEKEATDE